MEMPWLALTASILPVALLSGCGTASNDLYKWTWIAAFEGRILSRADTSAPVDAVVTVEGKWEATTAQSAYHVWASVGKAESERVSNARTLRVSVEADSFKPFDSTFSTAGLRNERVGNESSSDGTKWTLPDIYLERASAR
jgi:hypothetical protein